MVDGGYVSTGIVKSIKMSYDAKLKWQQRSNDVLLEVGYNDGQEWDKTLNLFGSFNKEKESWGSALKLKMFFESVGIENPEYNDDYTISDSYLDKAMNKEFLILSYPSVKLKDNGKPFWNTFPETMAVRRGRDRLKERFMKQVRDGWVKDYKMDDPLNATSSISPPSVPKEKNTSFDIAGLDI
tara:strand:- start:2535 stop:3083 length:549 start_codon:yes stop_codon:yes gene_type:complete